MNKILYFFLLIIGISLQNCSETEKSDPNVFFCDAENLSILNNQFISKGNVFKEAKGVTDDEAYSGEQSCLADLSHPNGMICTITDLKPGEIFKVSVFRKSTNNVGGVTLVSSDGSIKKSQGVSYGKKDANGWEPLSFNVQLPFNIDTTITLKVHIYNRNKKGELAYFDDLKITRLKLKRNTETVIDTINQIKIQLLDQDYAALIAFRDQALKQGIISKGLKQEFIGTLSYNNKNYRISLRLKGDWTDHLTGYKWSYRIKVKNKQAFLGLKSFSIQAPEVRSFLNEWVIHQICKKEDLLTTKYEFLPVNINGVNFGIYNLEEHFEKQLLESKKRREGPILKFSEDGFWERNLYLKSEGKDPNKPISAAATILTFKQKKTLQKKKLKNQFLIAQNLMLNYKKGSPNIEDFIDLKRLAQVYALMNVFNTDHAITWHNQRLYYNPINSKLEFIVYDCFSGPGSEYARTCQIFGNDKVGMNTINNELIYLNKNSFDNPEFLTYYLKYLKIYSSDKYLEETLNELNPAIDSLSLMLRKDYTFYTYDKRLLKSNAQKIRTMLPAYEDKVKNSAIQYQLKLERDTSCINDVPFKNFSLKAHLEQTALNGNTTISLSNYHCKPLKVIGYATKIFADSLILFKKPLIIERFSDSASPVNLNLAHKPKRLFFNVLGAKIDSTFKCKLLKWPRPKLTIPSSKITRNPLNKNSKIYSLSNDTLIFRSGKHTVKESIVIPKNMQVTFEPGTELLFNNKTFLLSYSSLKMTGTASKPIKISSTDRTANGFTIIQAPQKSTLKHVVFNGLNTLNIEGWELTGAVTFFESDVDISYCIFNNNNCEDGLNIVKSEFLLDNCTISNTLLDGFDGDFCNGIVLNSKFFNTGNDCLDFSGSTIKISACDIKNSGDKGISCGEKSTISIENVKIKDAVIGIASKDESRATINNLELENCITGYSIFQKKPEYGGAAIIVKKHKLTNVGTVSQCQEGSTITIK